MLITKPKLVVSRSRSGVTLIEVLTSIIVAVIGVAGVLILIPFGIRQAEIGLSLDDSTTMAENVLARFEIEGYGRVSSFRGAPCMPWIDAFAGGAQYLIPRDANLASCYWIDPISPANFNQANINGLFNPVGAVDVNVFQTGDANSGLADPSTGLMDRVDYQPRFVQLANLIDPIDFTNTPETANAIGAAFARRMMVTTDDLQFAFERDPNNPDIEIDELEPPRPFFDRAGDTLLRRQSRGETTCSLVAVPQGGTSVGGVVEGFDFYVLVYRDRDFTAQMPYTEVVAPSGADFVVQSTGTITLNAAIDIENDQWIMLITFDTQQRPQVGFFRVIGSDPVRSLVTIDGPLEFTIPQTPNVDTGVAHKTYAIALPNVVSVYKRRLELETTETFDVQ